METTISRLINSGLFTEHQIEQLKLSDSLCEKICNYIDASESYYFPKDDEEPFMSDQEFDSLLDSIKEDNLLIWQHLHKFILTQTEPGIYKFVIKTEQGEDFTQEMISLFKIKENNKPALCVNEIRNFFGSSYSEQVLHVSPKFDGCSLKVTFEKPLYNYDIKQIITRGGIDVTWLLKPIIIRDINKYNIEINEKTMCVTGELVIRKDTFRKKYSSEIGGDYENPRNFVSGMLKRKTLSNEILEDLDFVPCTDGVNPISVVIYYPEKNGPYKVISNVVFKGIPNNLRKIFDELKTDDFPYLCDGLVLSYKERNYIRKVKDNYPLNMVAVKFPAPTAITKVVGIDWTQKKSGKLTPRILLEPVKLDGSTVSACSGYNHYQVQSKRIGNGAIVEIEKSGDIIPIIKRVIQPTSIAEIEMPKVKYKISGKHLIAINDEETKIFKFVAAMRLLQLQGIGDTTADEIGNVIGYDIFKVFDTKYKPNILNKLGNGATWKALQEIYNIKTLPLNQLIELMQFDNVGPKIAMKVALLITKQSTDTQNMSSDVLSNVCRGEGIKQISENIQYLKSLGITVIKPIKISDDDLTFEMSGNPPQMTKSEFIKRIQQIFPNAIHTSLTKTTKVLFADNELSNTSKALKARKYNVKIVKYEDALNGKYKG